MRIASLLPSATEIVAALGLERELVAVSHECDFPPAVRGLPVVTRSTVDSGAASADIDAQVRRSLQGRAALYALDTELLARLQPDLILTQALCDVCAVSGADVEEAVDRLPGSPGVINVEPFSLDDVLETIRKVGAATGRQDAAAVWVREARTRIAAITERVRHASPRPSVALLEWTDPPFCGGHWNPEIVELAGGIDAFSNRGQPGRRVDWCDVATVDPDVLFFACCGFDLDRARGEVSALEERDDWHRLRCVREGRVFVANGNAFFSRPGPRLVESVEMLAHALWPDRVALAEALHGEMVGPCCDAAETVA